jgi:hypothetical protein
VGTGDTAGSAPIRPEGALELTLVRVASQPFGVTQPSVELLNQLTGEVVSKPLRHPSYTKARSGPS